MLIQSQFNAYTDTTPLSTAKQFRICTVFNCSGHSYVQKPAFLFYSKNESMLNLRQLYVRNNIQKLRWKTTFLPCEYFNIWKCYVSKIAYIMLFYIFAKAVKVCDHILSETFGVLGRHARFGDNTKMKKTTANSFKRALKRCRFKTRL